MAGAHRKGLETLWNAGYRDFQVVAACDVIRDKAESMADEVARFQGQRPQVYQDVGALLDGGPQCDAVDICTLHSDHHVTSVRCLEAGKHVTIEKPLAITLRCGRMMLDAAQKAGRILHVAENYRLSQEHRAIRWAIEEGLIGTPRMMYWIDVRRRAWYWGWREHKAQAGAGWALDGGVHYCDLFRYFLGPVSAVSGTARAFDPFRHKRGEEQGERIPVDVEDTCMAMLDFESGALGLWVTTTAAPGEAFSRHAVYGDAGSICWDTGLKSDGREMTMQELVSAHQESITDEEKERLFPLGLTDGVAIELHQFLEAVGGNGRVETDGLEGYKAEAVSLAVFESFALGRKVSMSEIENLEVEAYQGQINRELGIGQGR